ncbi:MAG: hypothetical protein WCF18_22220 [Chthoniobacteraceae bacterium]
MADRYDPESVLSRLRVLREELAPRLEELRAHGCDVDAFLEDCDRMSALLEGRKQPGFNVKAFIARLTAFTDEFKQTEHLHRQAELVGAVAALPSAVQLLGEAAAIMRAHGGPGELRTAAELEAQATAVRERLEECKLPMGELADASLTLAAQIAELNRRNLFRTAAAALYWEKQTPEWWAQLSPEARVRLKELTTHWRERREEVLGALPLEDRRRLEAMTLEDFNRPGACEP